MTSQGVASSDSSDSSDSSSAEVFVVKEAVFHEDPTESTDMMRAEILGVYQSSADAQNKALELYKWYEAKHGYMFNTEGRGVSEPWRGCDTRRADDGMHYPISSVILA